MSRVTEAGMDEEAQEDIQRVEQRAVGERETRWSARRKADELGPWPSANQPDGAVAHLDRVCLQGSGAGRCLDGAGHRLECTLRAPHHLAGSDVIE